MNLYPSVAFYDRVDPLRGGSLLMAVPGSVLLVRLSVEENGGVFVKGPLAS